MRFFRNYWLLFNCFWNIGIKWLTLTPIATLIACYKNEEALTITMFTFSWTDVIMNHPKTTLIRNDANVNTQISRHINHLSYVFAAVESFNICQSAIQYNARIYSIIRHYLVINGVVFLWEGCVCGFEDCDSVHIKEVCNFVTFHVNRMHDFVPFPAPLPKSNILSYCLNCHYS